MCASEISNWSILENFVRVELVTDIKSADQEFIVPSVDCVGNFKV